MTAPGPRNAFVGLPPPGMAVYCLLCGATVEDPYTAHGVAGYDSATGNRVSMIIHHTCRSALEERLHGCIWWDHKTLMIAEWPDSRERVPDRLCAPAEQRDQGDEVGAR